MHNVLQRIATLTRVLCKISAKFIYRGVLSLGDYIKYTIYAALNPIDLDMNYSVFLTKYLAIFSNKHGNPSIKVLKINFFSAIAEKESRLSKIAIIKEKEENIIYPKINITIREVGAVIAIHDNNSTLINIPQGALDRLVDIIKSEHSKQEKTKK